MADAQLWFEAADLVGASRGIFLVSGVTGSPLLAGPELGQVRSVVHSIAVTEAGEVPRLASTLSRAEAAD